MDALDQNIDINMTHKLCATRNAINVENYFLDNVYSKTNYFISNFDFTVLKVRNTVFSCLSDSFAVSQLN